MWKKWHSTCQRWTIISNLKWAELFFVWARRKRAAWTNNQPKIYFWAEHTKDYMIAWDSECCKSLEMIRQWYNWKTTKRLRSFSFFFVLSNDIHQKNIETFYQFGVRWMMNLNGKRCLKLCVNSSWNMFLNKSNRCAGLHDNFSRMRTRARNSYGNESHSEYLFLGGELNTRMRITDKKRQLSVDVRVKYWFCAKDICRSNVVSRWNRLGITLTFSTLPVECV